MADIGPRLRVHRSRALGVASLALAAVMQAQTGRFDLLGPKVDVHVTRGDQSLPIGSVPNLQAGDKLKIHADLPSTQSVHLLLVVAFLRGTTNPPPEKWFTRVETWKDRTHSEGVTVPVPDEAQQALIFIAPETGGDFSTLKSAVRGRPGTFVRASQDLNEASFEQSRIERYAQAIKQVPPGSAELLDHSHKLAATLQLKPNEDCFKRAPELQADCLSQSGSALLLDDGHGQTMAQMLSTGPTSDLIGAVAGTPVATAGGVGAYSAYVGTVLDVVRLLTGLHTAKYQYIPAIAFPNEDALNLRLNTAPSFNNPKSVIVIALPAIQKAVPPPLQLQDARHVSCLQQPRLVLPLVGAPLVFATGFAHDLTLHLNEPGPDGRTDLPLVPDAYEGGLLVSNAAPRKPLAAVAPEARGTTPTAVPAAPQQQAANASAQLEPLPGPIQGTGVVHGFWGFDKFEGPTLALQRNPGQNWTIATQGDLFAGRSNTVDLSSTGVACVQSVEFADNRANGPLQWRVDDDQRDARLTVKLPLEKTSPGGLKLAIHQYGERQPQKVAVTAYADAVRVDAVTAYAGDSYVLVRGAGLSGVKDAVVNGTTFEPAKETTPDDKLLRLEAQGGSVIKGTLFKAGYETTSQVNLKDGRQLHPPFHVEAPRPLISLLNTSFQPSTQVGLPITLGDTHAIPLDGKLTLALRSELPARFARSEKVEVAAVDGSASTTLSLQEKTLVLQDARIALGFVKPLETFGPSGFGPLQVRALASDGTVSDWIALGTLTRTPTLQTFTCSPKAGTPQRTTPTVSATPGDPSISNPTAAEPVPMPAPTPCVLSGSGLYLLDAVSGTPNFAQAVAVPAGFAQDSVQVPRPADGHTLYLRLRDDPTHIATVQVEAAKVRP